MGTKATLDGQDVTPYLRDRGVSWGPRDLNTHIDVATITLRGTSTVTPEDDMALEVTDTDGLTKVFGGVTRMPDAEETIGDGGAELTYQVRAQGWAALLYRIPITTTESYAAGVSDAYIVRDLLATYYGPVATSVTHRIRASRVDMPAMTFVAGQLSLGQALEQIAAEANGAVWWVDPADKAVHWNDTDRRAPFVISTTPETPRDGFRATMLGYSPTFLLRHAERSGLTSADETGNGNTATWNSQPTLRRQGAVDDECFAVLKDANAEYATLGDICDFAGVSPFSVGLWYKPSSLAAGRFMSKEIADGGGRQGWLLHFDGAGHFRIERWLNGVQNGVSGSQVLVIGWWYFLVATYDGANMRIYVNGTLNGGPSASALALTNHANPLAIGAHSAGSASGTGPLGDYAEEFAIPGALSDAQVAALYAARLKQKVGTRHITRLADSTQQAHRVKVVGNSINATYEATDWSEWARLQKRLAKESGAPSARILALPDVVDENITTLDQAKRRAWSILANQARRRPYVATVQQPGLVPGMRVDVISSKFGTGSQSQPTLRTPLRVRERPELSTGMGRFIVQRVEPMLKAGAKDEWEYRVTFGDFQPTLPIVIAKATGQGTIPRTAIAPKSITPNQMENRYRRVSLPIFSATVRTGSPAVAIHGANTRYRTYDFDANSLEEIVVEANIPRGLIRTSLGSDGRFTGSPTGPLIQVLIWYVPLTAAGGLAHMKVRATARYADVVDLSLDDTTQESVIDENLPVDAGAQNQLKFGRLRSNGIALVPDNLVSDRPTAVRVVIGRDGTDALDSLAGDLGIYAVELEYLADS